MPLVLPSEKKNNQNSYSLGKLGVSTASDAVKKRAFPRGRHAKQTVAGETAPTKGLDSHFQRPSLPKDLSKGNWTEQARRVLEERYLLRDDEGRVIETPDQMCWRVSWEIALAETHFGKGKKEVLKTAREYYQLLVSRKFLPNSPTLMNAGKENQLQYSACYVLPVEDSLVGIFDAIKWQALVHQSGGGTGFAFSRLRPQGSRVKSSQGVASGPISFLRIFNEATQQIKQGGTRRGANMGILRVDHPDILEFIHCKEDGSITNFNISVGATKVFMDAYYHDEEYALVAPHTGQTIGHLPARRVFREIAEGAWRTGDPGLIWLDVINSSPANPVPNLGPIEATNPCVTGDALISTKEGLIRMKEVVESHFHGGSREGSNMALIIDQRTLNENQPGTTDGRAVKFFDNGLKDVLKLVTKSGFELTATYDQRLLTPKGWVELQHLKPGDKIMIQSGPGSFSENFKLPFGPQRSSFPTRWSRELGQILGWLVGDGWLRTGDKNCRVGWTFSDQDFEILTSFQRLLNFWYGKDVQPVQRLRHTWHLSYHSKKLVDFFLKLGVKPVKAHEKEVPESIYTAPEEAVIGFLQGLFTADGTVATQEINNTRYLRLSAKSKLLLSGVQLLLINLGIKSTIYNRSRKARTGMFPYTDKQGNQKSYTTDGVLFELQISRDQIPIFLKKIGFLFHKHEAKIKKLLSYKGYYQTVFEDDVKEIAPAGKQRVYDLTEEKSYTFIANGIVSMDCGEQPLYAFDACNLGSLFLTYFVKEKNGSLKPEERIDWPELKRTVKLAVRFLDSVIERNPFPLPQIQETVKKIRRIGLGVGGWADMLVQLRVPYDSHEALVLGESVMKFIQENAHEASHELAQERGPFPLFFESLYRNGPPLRNSTVTTIAPTGTIGIIAGASTGIEPFFAVSFDHVVGQRKLTFVNPFFEKMARERSIPAEVMAKVKEHGTVRDIAQIPEDIRALFATAHDLAFDWHVRHQAVFQKHTDNAVSKTINLHHSATVEDIEKAYLLAYETGCRGITVYRDGCKESQVLNLGTGKVRATGQEASFNRPVDNQANGEITVEGEMPALRPRPKTLSGQTYHLKTPLGTAFITVNSDENHNPFEVFLNIGKAGSDIKADAEAIGRLISLSLRIPSAYHPRSVLEAIIDQLSNISGAAHLGFGQHRVKSLADAVAQILKEHLQLTQKLHPEDQPPAEKTSRPRAESPSQEALPLTQKRNPPRPQLSTKDLCPDCGVGSLIFEEGCAQCLSCGYSKC